MRYIIISWVSLTLLSEAFGGREVASWTFLAGLLTVAVYGTVARIVEGAVPPQESTSEKLSWLNKRKNYFEN